MFREIIAISGTILVADSGNHAKHIVRKFRIKKKYIYLVSLTTSIVSLIVCARSNAGRLMKSVLEEKENREIFQGILYYRRDSNRPPPRVEAKFYPLLVFKMLSLVLNVVK